MSSDDRSPSDALYSEVVCEERGELGSSSATSAGVTASTGESARCPSPEPLLGLASGALHEPAPAESRSRSPGVWSSGAGGAEGLTDAALRVSAAGRGPEGDSADSQVEEEAAPPPGVDPPRVLSEKWTEGRVEPVCGALEEGSEAGVNGRPVSESSQPVCQRRRPGRRQSPSRVCHEPQSSASSLVRIQWKLSVDTDERASCGSSPLLLLPSGSASSRLGSGS